MSTENPRRRIKITLTLGADSWDEAVRALHGIEHRLAEAQDREEPKIAVTSGGYGSGYHLEADEDPTIDHDSYFEAVEAYRARRKAERESKP